MKWVPDQFYDSDYFLSSSLLAGLGPVLRKLAILFNRSNQKGAPMQMARIVTSHPAICFNQSSVFIFHPIGNPFGTLSFTAAISCFTCCRFLSRSAIAAESFLLP